MFKKIPKFSRVFFKFQDFETAAGYEEIAANRVKGSSQSDRRICVTEEELMAGRHHTLDLENLVDHQDNSETICNSFTFHTNTTGFIGTSD